MENLWKTFLCISGYSEATKNMENYLLKACPPDLENSLSLFTHSLN